MGWEKNREDEGERGLVESLGFNLIFPEINSPKLLKQFFLETTIFLYRYLLSLLQNLRPYFSVPTETKPFRVISLFRK